MAAALIATVSFAGSVILPPFSFQSGATLSPPHPLSSPTTPQGGRCTSPEPKPQGARPHLKDGHVVLPVDLVGGRVEPAALPHVLVENAAALHVAQAELTQVELREPRWRRRRRRRRK